MGPREGTPKPKECSGAFTKSKSEMKKWKKWNTSKLQIKSKKEERNVPCSSGREGGEDGIDMIGPFAFILNFKIKKQFWIWKKYV